MRIPPLPHDWNLDFQAAVALQKTLSGRVETCDRLGPVEYVAGVDVGFIDGGATARAAVAVLDFPGLQDCDQALARCAVTFPYRPGLLSFREIPVILLALEKLRQTPDLILCDGQGIAHPRRFGIACHLGVLLDIPTIGVAKTRLLGRHEPVPDEKGAWVGLYDRDELIGAVLRTRRGVKPLYVSIGHRISLERAIEYVMTCVTKYRLPETTRAAHRLASG